MKKIIMSLICLISILISPFAVNAEIVESNLFIDNVNLQNDSIKAYFDVMDTEGKFNNADIKMDSVTGDIDGNKLKLKNIKRFESTNEGITYILMADISKSLNAKANENIKKMYGEIVNKAGSKDKIAVITFGDTETVIQDFTSDKTALIEKINSIGITDNNTDLYRAVTKAEDMLAGNPSLTLKKAIIIMSDGEESNDSGITKDEVLLKISDSHIPIFSVGLKISGDANSVEKLKVLGSFARLSQGQDFILEDSSGKTTDIANAVMERLNKSYVAEFDGSGVERNGQTGSFNLSIKLDGKTTLTAKQSVVLENTPVNPAETVSPDPTASIDPNASPVISPSASGSDSGGLPTVTSTPASAPFYENPYYICGAAAVLVVIIIVVILFTGGKKKGHEANVADKDLSIEDDTGTDRPNDEVNINPANVGKTVNVGVPQNETDSDSKTLPPKQSVNQGIKIKLTKLGRNDGESVYEFNLSSSYIIGRDPSKAGLVFKDDQVLSGKHCEFILKDNMVFISDLGSTNGTYVNGIPISGSYRLHNDDILLIGSMELRVTFDEENNLLNNV